MDENSLPAPQQPAITEHHIIHFAKAFPNYFPKNNLTIMLPRDDHKKLHDLFDHYALGPFPPARPPIACEIRRDLARNYYEELGANQLSLSQRLDLYEQLLLFYTSKHPDDLALRHYLEHLCLQIAWLQEQSFLDRLA